MASQPSTFTDRRDLITNLADEDVRHIIDSQVKIANYLLRVESGKSQADRTFHSNRDIWNAILTERLRANMHVTLENFHILEWFPRSPGLYFTREGKRSRESANQFVQSLEKRSSEVKYALGSSGDTVTVYNPYGKIAMLKGGLGAIRLKPRMMGSDQNWFMSA